MAGRFVSEVEAAIDHNEGVEAGGECVGRDERGVRHALTVLRKQKSCSA
jgi:hypothetical protein